MAPQVNAVRRSPEKSTLRRVVDIRPAPVLTRFRVPRAELVFLIFVECSQAFECAQGASFHLPVLLQLNSRQSSLPQESLGSPECQLVYDSGVPDGLHTHVPSEAASVPPIHTLLPAAAVTSSAFSAAESTFANCLPAVRQASLASLHDRASFISV